MAEEQLIVGREGDSDMAIIRDGAMISPDFRGDTFDPEYDSDELPQLAFPGKEADNLGLVSASGRAKQIANISAEILERPDIAATARLKELVDTANREFNEELEYFKTESVKTAAELRNASILANNIVRNLFELEAAPEISRLAYRIIVAGDLFGAVIVVGSGKYRFAEPDKNSANGFSRFSLYTGKSIGLTNIIFELIETAETEENEIPILEFPDSPD